MRLKSLIMVSFTRNLKRNRFQILCDVHVWFVLCSSSKRFHIPINKNRDKNIDLNSCYQRSFTIIHLFIHSLEATGRNTSANGNNQSANQAVLPGMQTQKKTYQENKSQQVSYNIIPLKKGYPWVLKLPFE